jgi:hypothetical protein
MVLAHKADEDPLSPIEIAILLFTNDLRPRKQKNSPDQRIVLTSKSAYLWAAIASHLLEQAPAHVEEIDDLLRGALRGVGDEVRRYYSSFTPLQPPFEDKVFQSVLEQLEGTLGVHIPVRDLQRRVSHACKSLTDRGYIRDPVDIIIGSASVAMLGLVPYSFSQVTEKGQVTKRKLEAVFWRYEMSRVLSTRKVKRSLDSRLIGLLFTLKSALIQAIGPYVEDQLAAMREADEAGSDRRGKKK